VLLPHPMLATFQGFRSGASSRTSEALSEPVDRVKVLVKVYGYEHASAVTRLVGQETKESDILIEKAQRNEFELSSPSYSLK
jgi:hypothetical protein